LTLEGNSSCQYDVWIGLLQWHNLLSRHHVKPDGKAGYEILPSHRQQ